MPNAIHRPPRLPFVFQDYTPPLYFITFCTLNRRPVLATPILHDAFRSYAEAALEHGVGVGQYVIMPDHVHLFVRIGGDTKLGPWVRGLKRVMGKAYAQQRSAAEEQSAAEKQSAAETAATTQDTGRAAPGQQSAAETAATTQDAGRVVAAVPGGAFSSQPTSISIWQDGFFDHLLRHNESYREKWCYVRDNPVRKGLVANWDAWPYRGEIMQIGEV